MQNKPWELGARQAIIISLPWQVFQPDFSWLMAGAPCCKEEGKGPLQKTLPRSKAEVHGLVVTKGSDSTPS